MPTSNSVPAYFLALVSVPSVAHCRGVAKNMVKVQLKKITTFNKSSIKYLDFHAPPRGQTPLLLFEAVI